MRRRTTTSRNKVISLYNFFAKGRENDIAPYLARPIKYFRWNFKGGYASIGPVPTMAAFGEWRDHLKEMKVGRRQLQPVAPEKLSAVYGAVEGWVVTYVLKGFYVRTFPGMAADAPAHGYQVALPMTDRVLFNIDGLIMQIDNSFDPAALHKK